VVVIGAELNQNGILMKTIPQYHTSNKICYCYRVLLQPYTHRCGEVSIYYKCDYMIIINSVIRITVASLLEI
jgi:hypothetical protein